MNIRNSETREVKNVIPDEDRLNMAAELINNAKRLVIYAGGGVRISKTIHFSDGCRKQEFLCATASWD